MAVLSPNKYWMAQINMVTKKEWWRDLPAIKAGAGLVGVLNIAVKEQGRWTRGAIAPPIFLTRGLSSPNIFRSNAKKNGPVRTCIEKLNNKACCTKTQ